MTPYWNSRQLAAKFNTDPIRIRRHRTNELRIQGLLFLQWLFSSPIIRFFPYFFIFFIRIRTLLFRRLSSKIKIKFFPFPFRNTALRLSMLQYGYCFSRNFKDIRSKQSQARIRNVSLRGKKSHLTSITCQSAFTVTLASLDLIGA